MAHYADGTEAKVGDQVVGKLYNSGPDKKAGTIISVTPGVESCNAMVQFTDAQLTSIGDEGIIGLAKVTRPRMAVHDEQPRLVKGLVHGTSGPMYALTTCVDYCATNELTKVG